MPEIVSVVFDGAEGYATKTVDFEDVLDSGGGSDDEDVRFFANADLVACAVEGFTLEVGVEGEVIEASVS